MNLNYRVINDYPKSGIKFIDMIDLYHTQLSKICKDLEENIFNCDAILGIESRGFITASVLASNKNKPLILVRKSDKALPGYITTKSFNNEYDTRQFSFPPEIIFYKKVVVVDDLIASGSTINNIIDSLKELGVETVQVLSTILLSDLDPQIHAPLYYVKEISCKDL